MNHSMYKLPECALSRLMDVNPNMTMISKEMNMNLIESMLYKKQKIEKSIHSKMTKWNAEELKSCTPFNYLRKVPQEFIDEMKETPPYLVRTPAFTSPRLSEKLHYQSKILAGDFSNNTSGYYADLFYKQNESKSVENSESMHKDIHIECAYMAAAIGQCKRKCNSLNMLLSSY